MSEKILEIKHDHFKLYVSSANARFLYNKAKIRNDLRQSTFYQISGGEISVTDLEVNDSKPIICLDPKKCWPVFYENNSYLFYFEFEDSFVLDSDPYIKHELKEITDQFSYLNNRFFGHINFANEIGKFILQLVYSSNNVTYKFNFEFEVFPIKLNYKEDYQKIIKKIQDAYPLLVLDFIKKTFNNVNVGGNVTHEFIWWNIFQSIYDQLIKDMNFIIHHPHNKLVNKVQYVRRDKLKYLTASQEEEVYNDDSLGKENKYYRIENKQLTVDNLENRFVKYGIKYIYIQHNKIFNFIQKVLSKKITDQFKNEASLQHNKLVTLLHNPIWKSVGEFSGFKQESLTIQRKPGYAGFYRKFILLKQAVKLLEGNYKLELKNISELYQIWCFLEIKDIIFEITHIKPELSFEEKFELKHWTDLRIHEVFSCFKFNLANGDVIELYHDYSYKKTALSKNNILRSYTEEQRPDITLRLTKKDIPDSAIHTYLFDAKYRIKTSLEDDIPDDIPPPDTLNQMHRYRDSLYFKTKNQFDQAEKGIIGAFVLFPGEGNKAAIIEKNYYKSIDHINIGAFPLNLTDNNKSENRILLKEYLEKRIVDKASKNILKEAPAQKYVTPEFPEGMVLIGGTRGDKPYQDFFESGPPFYFFPINKRKELSGIRKLKYFSPWIKGIGCKELYAITEVSVLKRSELFESTHPLYKVNDKLYIKISLTGKKIELDREIRSTEGNLYIRYATLNSFIKASKFSDFEN